MVLFRLFISLFFLFSFSEFSTAQNSTFIKTKEDSIVALWKQVKTVDTDSDKININNSIRSILSDLLKISDSFYYTFDSLPQFGKIHSPDKLFRIITWNIISMDGVYSYYGFIQVRDVKANAIQVFELTDRFSDIKNPEKSVLSCEKWFGGLYYKALLNKIDHITYYTIFSLRYNDLFTSSKIIDILYFDEFGNPVFGAPLFEENKDIKLRKVFEYAANVAMHLNYDENLKMIIFDHLSPSESIYEGKRQYYGPDFTFDGYKLVNKRWKLFPDLDLKRPANTTTNPVKSKPVSNKVVR